MNAYTSLLQAGYDFHGIKLDLFGHMDEDGYNVTEATVARTTQSVGADAETLSLFSAHLDDTLPTAAELRREERDQDRIDYFQINRRAA